MELPVTWTSDAGDVDASAYLSLSGHQAPQQQQQQQQYQTVPDDSNLRYQDWLDTNSPQSLPEEGAVKTVATIRSSNHRAAMHRKRKYWEEEEDEEGEDRHRKLANLDDNAEHGGGDGDVREHPRGKETGSPGPRMTSWDLAADLEGSFSGLGGVDLSTTSYNMSEALLALPSLPGLKQEAPSPTSLSENCVPGPGVREADSNTPSFKNVLSSPHSSSSSLHQLLQPAYNNVTSTQSTHSEAFQPRGTKTAAASSTTTLQELGVNCRFQYVLAAATSIAAKINEETITYLNQGQSYEIKLKKVGELLAYRGKIFKSVIRVCFHERRLQYMEQEQMAGWRASRPGDRIIEIDVPLSYGICEAAQDSWLLNTVEFLWDPTKEVGVYIKVNCISTEFTPKKHGGEKGVPFRIQVETYMQGEDGMLTRLHAAGCQVKVFKLKGGDRKHKQDREKIKKRPPAEQAKYQRSLECTILNDIPIESLYPTSVGCVVSSSLTTYSTAEVCLNQSRGVVTPAGNSSVQAAPTIPPEEISPQHVTQLASLSSGSGSPEQQASSHQETPHSTQAVGPETTPQQLALWLQENRFEPFLNAFATFKGEDILRLSRDDLTQICGISNGIRLFNAVHSKAIPPRLTIYLCMEQSPPPEHHALFLNTLSTTELTGRLAELLGVAAEQILKLYVLGPSGMHVIMTNDVVRNMKQDSLFSIEVMPDHTGEQYRLLLKPWC